MLKASTASVVVATALFLFAAPTSAQEIPSDSLIKGSLPSVYYLAADGGRYIFPNGATYASWFSDYSAVITVSDEILSSIPLKGNVTYRPGVRLVKIQTDPKVYAVAKGGTLRWIENEELAKELYGEGWNLQIDDVPDVFFTNYTLGQPIRNASDFNPPSITADAPTIDADKGLSHAVPAEPATPAVPATPATPEQPPSDSDVPTPATPATPAIPAVPAVPQEPEPTEPPSPPEEAMQAIVADNFDTYSNESIVNQGGWKSYANGNNFVVQEMTAFGSGKALYAGTIADSVIAREGKALSDGKQAFHVRTSDRSLWGPYADGNAQVRVSKGLWGAPFAAVSFKSDGNVAYYDVEGDLYQNFATYDDNDWVLLEIEWRSNDPAARYRVNEDAWTEWKPFWGSASFTDFNHVGMDFDLPSGSGGVYLDQLQ